MGQDELYQFGSLVLDEVGYLLPGPQGYSHFLQVINCAHQLKKNTNKHVHESNDRLEIEKGNYKETTHLKQSKIQSILFFFFFGKLLVFKSWVNLGYKILASHIQIILLLF